MQLSILNGQFNIHRLPPGSAIPNLDTEEFYNIVQTNEELSLVCSDSIAIDAEKTEPNWRIIKVLGPLEFSLTGVIARISQLLADAKISIFVISTFDTDYVMLKSEKLEQAKYVLESNKYHFE